MSDKIKKYKGNDEQFLSACSRAGVVPTHRQWRKWVQRRGSAYKNRAQ